jgi:hypothetical protein
MAKGSYDSTPSDYLHRQIHHVNKGGNEGGYPYRLLDRIQGGNKWNQRGNIRIGPIPSIIPMNADQPNIRSLVRRARHRS